MKAHGGGAGKEMSPESLDSVLIGVTELVAVGSIGFRRIHGPGLVGKAVANIEKVVPVALALVVVVLRHVDKIIQFGMIERALVHVGSQVPIVPHFRHVNAFSAPGRTVLEESRPVGAPLLVTVGFVVDAVKHVVVGEREVEHFFHEPLLIPEHDLVISLFGRCEEEGLLVRARVVGIAPGESGLIGRVIDIVDGIVRMRLPSAAVA